MNTKIKHASKKHAADIAVIEKECFSAPWSEKQIADEIEKENSVFLIAETDGVFSGYISGENICGEFYIGNFAVNRSFRNCGVGTMLLSSLCSEAKALLCEFVTLEVRKSNTAARSIYKKAGFENLGERKNFYSHPTENACIYTKYFI